MTHYQNERRIDHDTEVKKGFYLLVLFLTILLTTGAILSRCHSCNNSLFAGRYCPDATFINLADTLPNKDTTIVGKLKITCSYDSNVWRIVTDEQAAKYIDSVKKNNSKRGKAKNKSRN